jgi:hypothetical protein
MKRLLGTFSGVNIIMSLLSFACVHYFLLSDSLMAVSQNRKPRIPAEGKVYTLGSLFDELNANNAHKDSNFFVACGGPDGKTPLRNAQYWPSSGPNLTDALPADYAGFDVNFFKNPANANLQVILKKDPKLIDFLLQNGRLDQENKERYSNLLLYFELKGYRLYLDNPFPGKIFKMALSSVNPAAGIIVRWDFSSSFKPTVAVQATPQVVVVPVQAPAPVVQVVSQVAGAPAQAVPAVVQPVQVPAQVPVLVQVQMPVVQPAPVLHAPAQIAAPVSVQPSPAVPAKTSQALVPAVAPQSQASVAQPVQTPVLVPAKASVSAGAKQVAAPVRPVVASTTKPAIAQSQAKAPAKPAAAPAQAAAKPVTTPSKPAAKPKK